MRSPARSIRTLLVAAVAPVALVGVLAAPARAATPVTFTSSATIVDACHAMINFRAVATGSPAPVITAQGQPSWLHVSPGSPKRAPGTAHLSGNPPLSIIGPVSFTLTADNGDGSPAVQTVTIDIVGFLPPVGTTFTMGTYGSATFSVPAGMPGVAFSVPAVPAHLTGLTFTDNGDGTATLAGTPVTGDRTAPIRVYAELNGHRTFKNFAITIQP